MTHKYHTLSPRLREAEHAVRRLTQNHAPTVPIYEAVAITSSAFDFGMAFIASGSPIGTFVGQICADDNSGFPGTVIQTATAVTADASTAFGADWVTIWTASGFPGFNFHFDTPATPYVVGTSYWFKVIPDAHSNTNFWNLNQSFNRSGSGGIGTDTQVPWASGTRGGIDSTTFASPTSWSVYTANTFVTLGGGLKIGSTVKWINVPDGYPGATAPHLSGFGRGTFAWQIASRFTWPS